MAYDIKESGARIRQLRIQHDHAQEKLAGALNVDRSLLIHIEAGKRGCSVDLPSSPCAMPGRRSARPTPILLT